MKRVALLAITALLIVLCLPNVEAAQSPIEWSPLPTPSVLFCQDGCPMPFWIPTYWLPYHKCSLECIECQAAVKGQCDPTYDEWQVSCNRECMDAKKALPISPLPSPLPTYPKPAEPEISESCPPPHAQFDQYWMGKYPLWKWADANGRDVYCVEMNQEI